MYNFFLMAKCAIHVNFLCYIRKLYLCVEKNIWLHIHIYFKMFEQWAWFIIPRHRKAERGIWKWVASVRPSVRPSQILCAPLLLQFFTDSFETLQGSLLSLEDDPLEFSCCYDYIFRSYWPFMTLYHILLVHSTTPTVFHRFFWNFTRFFVITWGWPPGIFMMLRLFFLELLPFYDFEPYTACALHCSFSFLPILLKLYRVLCNCLAMIPWNFHVATIIFSRVIALL